MQIEALDTFVKIAELGNFNRAAETLYVTPSTVSARIQMLEESLGQRLFHRSRSNVTLTQAGSVFLPYARSVVRSWQKARSEIALPTGFDGMLSIAAAPVVWRDVMVSFLASHQHVQPTIAINAVITDVSTAAAKLNAGEVDLAIAYEPALKTGWSATKLFTDALRLVSTTPRGLVRWDPKYVYVDWGAKFREDVFREFPVDDTPVVTFSDGDAALEYILRVGGSAYLPQRWVDTMQDRLFVVTDSPILEASLFAVFDPDLLDAGDRRKFVDGFIEAAVRAIDVRCARNAEQVTQKYV